MRIRELMTRNVVTLNAQADLELAEGLMQVMRIRHLPVVTGNRLVGLVTHRDLLRAALSPLGSHTPAEQAAHKATVTVSQVMRDDVATVGPDTDVRDAIAQMRRHKYGCLPVVDAEGDLIGIVTEADFLHLMQALLERVENFDLASLRTLAGELRAEALAEQDTGD